LHCVFLSLVCQEDSEKNMSSAEIFSGPAGVEEDGLGAGADLVGVVGVMWVVGEGGETVEVGRFLLKTWMLTWTSTMRKECK
jgi:hypothetical protein